MPPNRTGARPDSPEAGTAPLQVSVDLGQGLLRVPAVAEVVRSLLDALPGPACAVDRTGTVAVTSSAWDAEDRPAAGLPAQHLTAGPVDGPLDAALRAVLAGELAEWSASAASEDGWCCWRVAALPAVAGALVAGTDVTERAAATRRRLHESRHDDLTGLPKRALLLEHLQQALTRSADEDTSVVVVSVDLAGLAAHSTDHGSGVGDDLLLTAADRLRAAVAEGDTVARVGPRQLVVVREGVRDEAEARALGSGLHAALLAGDRHEAPDVGLTAVVGVALGPPFEDADALLSAADAGLVRGDTALRGAVHVVSRSMQRDAERRARIARDVRTAARRGELRVDYQPVLDLRTGEVEGVEALLRWSHPELGELSPAEFVPVAEDTGAMVELGEWVLLTVCDRLAGQQPADRLRVSVNLSAQQLADDEVVDVLAGGLRERGLDPDSLVLEVTESAVVADREHSTDVLRRLRELGVGLALDDFGTGWSSLVYLRDFPFDSLKIDRRFVAGLGVVPDDTAIVASVIDLAHAVGMRAVAEGVETVEQLDHLRLLGCDCAQGFLWASAVPADEIDTVLLALPVGPLRGREAEVRRAAVAREERLRARAAELVSEGASLHTVAAALNADGLLTSRGTRWSASAAAHLVAGLRPPG